MKYLAAIALMGLLILPAACGNKGEGTVTLNVYNWGDYIESDVVRDFEKKYPSISVNYEMFDTNEDMYAKIKNSNTNYDILFPSDYMIERLIQEDMLVKLDFSNIPNYALIADTFKNLPFDPANEYSVPYMWGTVGILYNTSIITDPIEGYEALWDPKYEKQVFMLDSMRDTIGITLKMLGYSQNSTSTAQLEEAKNKLIEQKSNVLAYVGDDVKDKMIAGEAGMAVVWSGDAVYCMELNDDLAFVLPAAGSNYFVDSVVVPKTGRHKKEAELFINFICETEIALRNTEYIGYSSPHTEAAEQLPEQVRQSAAAYPGAEIIAKCEVFRDLGDATKLYDRIWTEIKAGL